MPSSPRSDEAEALAELRELSNSPFEPEPPRRSLTVDATMALARRLGHRELLTPHLHHGSDLDKAMYEYERADELWEAFGGSVTPAVFQDCDVLDVGCGWGGKDVRYAERYGPRSISGFDLPGVFDPEVSLEFARQRGVADRCSFTVGLAEQIPFEADRFDVAIVDDVLEHVRDPERVLGECGRVLHTGGVLIVKFPSVRMMGAHHLDRALTWPGLHFILPLRRWAAGLNDHLLRHRGPAGFEPFDEVVSTPYHKGVTRNLNGLGFRDFEEIVARSGFRVRQLEIVPAPIAPTDALRRVAIHVQRAAARVPAVRERLGVTIVFVGTR